MAGGLGIEEVIGNRRNKVLRLARYYGATEVRRFGSLARREANGESDVDMIVDPIPGRELNQFKLSEALESLLGTTGQCSDRGRDVLADPGSGDR